MLSVWANRLLDKEHSGCHALLRDDKVLTVLIRCLFCYLIYCLVNHWSPFAFNFQVEDLSRMFRLFSKVPRGLDPVSSIFKQVNYFLACPLINYCLIVYQWIMLTGISYNLPWITFTWMFVYYPISSIVPLHIFSYFYSFTILKKYGLISYSSMLLLKALLWSNRLRMLQAPKRFGFFLSLFFSL